MNRREISRLQATKLRVLLKEVAVSNDFYREKLRGFGWEASVADESADLESLLGQLPLTTKQEVQESVESAGPYGRVLTYPVERYCRLHQTSGTTGRPLRWLDTPESWEWIIDCWGQIFRAVGVKESDRFFFPFSFGPFLGFWSAYEAAARRGHFVLPGGGLRTRARLNLLVENAANIVVCTPTYALNMATVARAAGIDLRASPVKLLIVAGEPGGNVAATKARLESEWGARCCDHSGMTEVGPYGVEALSEPGDLYVLEDEFIVEALVPGSEDTVADGECGELVITGLGRVGSPLLRYRTGDLVRWTKKPGAALPFGRLLGGVLGRLDEMFIVRGNNVYPSAIENVVRQFPEIDEYRIRVQDTGSLANLVIEIEPAQASGADAAGVGDDTDELVERVREATEKELLFRAEVRAVPAGTLPKFELKGKRIVRESHVV